MDGYIFKNISNDGNSKSGMARLIWNLILAFASLLIESRAFAQITNVTIQAEADAFIRAAAPDENYGRAGNLFVAGANSLNGFNVPGGVGESLARFNASDLVSSLDSFFGNHDWSIVEAIVHVYETAAPNNAIFSRGGGRFAIDWLSNGDDWIEGTGSPNAPTADGITFNDLGVLLHPPQDLRLGIFTNAAADGFLDFKLSLPDEFTADFRSGSLVTLHFLPLDDQIGFTFLSRSDRRPELQMTMTLEVSSGSLPRIISITNSATNQVTLTFLHKTNWTTKLQRQVDALALDSAWETIFTAPPEEADRTLEFSEPISADAQFYRLEASPPP